MSGGADGAEPYEAWDAVLAGVEADVRESESLLSGSVAPTGTTGTAYGVPAAPAETMLPGQYPLDLPPLSSMPPVPPELTERIAVLRSRIVALRAEIEDEIGQWRRWQETIGNHVTVAAPAMAAGARFIDRRA